jgi:hypothetical protein
MTNRPFSRKYAWLAKTALVVTWPFIALLFAAAILAVFVIAWGAIPFCEFYRKEDGTLSIRFPTNNS